MIPDTTPDNQNTRWHAPEQTNSDKSYHAHQMRSKFAQLRAPRPRQRLVRKLQVPAKRVPVNVVTAATQRLGPGKQCFRVLSVAFVGHDELAASIQSNNLRACQSRALG
jgi:hypothetical protein